MTDAAYGYFAPIADYLIDQQLLTGVAYGSHALSRAKARIRLSEGNAPGKQAPLINNKVLTDGLGIFGESRRIFAFALLTGLRRDSLLAIEDTDVAIKPDHVSITIRKDKVLTHQSRTIRIFCNCTSTMGPALCPLHSGIPDLPITKKRFSAVITQCKIKGHSFRRALLYNTILRVQGTQEIETEFIQERFGWSSRSMIGHYLGEAKAQDEYIFPVFGALKDLKFNQFIKTTIARDETAVAAACKQK